MVGRKPGDKKRFWKQNAMRHSMHFNSHHYTKDGLLSPSSGTYRYDSVIGSSVNPLSQSVNLNSSQLKSPYGGNTSQGLGSPAPMSNNEDIFNQHFNASTLKGEHLANYSDE